MLDIANVEAIKHSLLEYVYVRNYRVARLPGRFMKDLLRDSRPFTNYTL